MKTKRRRGPVALLACAAVWSLACSREAPPQGAGGSESGASDVSSFLSEANDTLLRLGIESNQAGWVQQTYITQDTEALSARADQAYVSAVTEYSKQAARMESGSAAPEEQRQLSVLKNTLTMAAPSESKEAAELTQLVTSMSGMYGRGKYCPGGEAAEDSCLDVEEITEILAKDRNPARLLEVWEGWRTIAPPMKPSYQRFVELSNKGARELGFADTGAMWRSRYDMPPDMFAKELDRLWEQLRPLYVSLHTHVRAKLRERYGEVVPAAGPIPAHLLGNIWAQDWSNVYDIVAPRTVARTYSLTDILRTRRTTPVQMVKYGEGFFTSLGFAPLPETFFERSLFTKPRDREVVCHASAWYIDQADDLRIKMCIDPTGEDFTTIHHELGHVFYAREYKGLPVILRDSANDGFMEAVGDTVALSVTPESW